MSLSLHLGLDEIIHGEQFVIGVEELTFGDFINDLDDVEEHLARALGEVVATEEAIGDRVSQRGDPPLTEQIFKEDRVTV